MKCLLNAVVVVAGAGPQKTVEKGHHARTMFLVTFWLSKAPKEHENRPFEQLSRVNAWGPPAGCRNGTAGMD